MTAAWLTAALVLLVGARVRLGPPARRPAGPGLPSPAGPPRSLAGSIRRRSRSGRPTDPGEVAAWCDRLARATRSGATLTAALRDAEPPARGDAVARIVLRLDRGASLSDAVRLDGGDPNLDLALTVVRACAEQGGPPSEPIDRVAATLRGRAADLAERRTQSAQARLSAAVMTLLPIAMLAVLLVSSATVRTVMSTRIGLLVLAAGLVLNLLGWRWMRRLIAGGRR
jgi:tight adherence protein B